MLVLADAPTRRISFFDTRNSAIPTFARSFDLDFDPDDVCLAGNVIVVVGLRDGRIVHEFDPSGRRLRSYGGLFGQPDDPVMTRHSKTASVVACSPVGDLVAVASVLSPEIRIYDVGNITGSTPVPSTVEVVHP
jgi:hypothetical protein